MDLTPIYDLRARLRAAMIAGTNLLSEDFRLKRAVEAVTPLEQASPVFARIGQLSRSLLDPALDDREGALLDTITLVDAVLCTQGVVAINTSGEQETENGIQKLSGGTWGSTITNAPYSVVSALLEALTSSGSGHFSYVSETHEAHPELFLDYRVKSALVQALGASYSELADLVETWLKDEDASLLPLLQNPFDPGGKKEMVRRVRVMEAIAPKEANPFFVEVLPDAKKEVRLALIFALRHCPENEDLLWDITKTEKGNSRKAVYQALAHMESERVEQFFTDLCEKKPLEAMEHLQFTQNEWATRLVAKELEEQIQPFVDREDYFLTQEQSDVLLAVLRATVGKTGPEILNAFQQIIRLGDKLNHPFEDKKKSWTFPLRYSRGNRSNSAGSFQDMLIEMIHRTLIRTADSEIGRLAMEIYEEKLQKREGWEDYFPVAAMAHLLVDEDCSGWLSEQLLDLRRPTKLYASLRWAWNSISWSEARQAFTFQDIDTNFGLVDGYQMSYVHTLKQDMTGKIADILMQCRDEGLDNLLAKYVSPGNETYRAKLEEYYYKRALVAGDNRSYLRHLKTMGCKRCEGLAVHYFKGRSSKPAIWELKSFVNYYLPGDNQAKYREMQAVYELIKSGKIQLQSGPGNKEEDLLNYLEELKV